ncbi:MAG: PBP1A family penicillin-binding protein, partial [Desulfobacterales bacterium]|nr:PBP1A family penicillin-binding protein [Desulfobacterales bacterium]
VCGITMGAFLSLTHDLPQIRSLENYRPSAVTRIYSADKVLLTELFQEKRKPVPIEVIPKYLKSALVATEDRSFYKHSGIDLKGVFRAIIKDLWAGEFVEGASTITQQLAKTLFLTPKKSLIRKIKEAILAFQLERRYTKDEILELYLNQVYFGSGAYGVESAADLFFGKSVKDLNLSESALIAAMPKAPSRYSPLINRTLAIKRRNMVLKQMFQIGLISEATYQQALNKHVILKEKKQHLAKAPYFLEYVKKSLETDLGSSLLYREGLTIYSTLSYELQKAAEDAIDNGLTALGSRMQKQQIENPNPQGALVALDLKSGGILAMVGGKNFSQSSFNRATMARRQPGSAFKPIVYAVAIEKGFSQNKMILDAPIVFKGGKDGKDWKPENFSKKYRGEMTLRKALSISENIPAVRLIEMLGSSSVAQFGQTLGIESPLSQNLSLSLGTSGVTLTELTSVYSFFTNQGEKIKAYCVMEILDHSGRIIWHVKPEKKVVMSRAGAAIMTNMLQAVINEGTGKKARDLGHYIAGKTGTTNDYKDALFVGFSPSIAAGVWVGEDAFTTLGKWETGAKAALPIWIEFMRTALADKPYQHFDIPDDVVQIRMDSVTGMLALDDSPGAVVALFKKGTAPTQHR